jgi:TIR domain
MNPLSQLPDLIGFFSYSREDDEDFKGALSALRERIRRNLRAQLGRTSAAFKLFQDTEAIAHGALWEREIKDAIAKSVFFIPIITPTAVNSRYCMTEFDLFLAREAELGREDLIFPILYIRVPALENEELRPQNNVLETVHARQFADWTKLRLHNVVSIEFGNKIEHFCQDMVEVLSRPMISPERRNAEAIKPQRSGQTSAGSAEDAFPHFSAQNRETSNSQNASIVDRLVVNRKWLWIGSIAVLLVAAFLLLVANWDRSGGAPEVADLPIQQPDASPAPGFVDLPAQPPTPSKGQMNAAQRVPGAQSPSGDFIKDCTAFVT